MAKPDPKMVKNALRDYIGLANLANKGTYLLYVVDYNSRSFAFIRPEFMFEFHKDDIESLKIASFCREWTKYYMRLKTGIVAYISVENCLVDTFGVGKTNSVQYWFERIENYRYFEFFLGDLLFKDDSLASTASSKCPGCGAEITDDMDFCGECGRKLK